jgi:3-hydroxyacyl-[acyl-carrier-protein] dehydratase
MRFSLIDRIESLQRGVSLTGIKSLSLAEEYLGDHFPGFPVMPGVLMLESMTQASAWLIRASEDFAHSMVVLTEARNVKYGQFVEPGQTLRVTAQILSQDARQTVLKTRGEVDGRATVAARLTLDRYNLADDDPAQAATDESVKDGMRRSFALIFRERAS